VNRQQNRVAYATCLKKASLPTAGVGKRSERRGVVGSKQLRGGTVLQPRIAKKLQSSDELCDFRLRRSCRSSDHESSWRKNRILYYGTNRNVALALPVSQAAAIPIIGGRICLVSSSNGRGWVIPKGHVEPGQTAREAAEQEAWEEAGLRGVLADEPLDSYQYEKNGITYKVAVFLMKVTDTSPAWPEDHRRTRQWMRANDAEQYVQAEGLRRILARLQLSSEAYTSATHRCAATPSVTSVVG